LFDTHREVPRSSVRHLRAVLLAHGRVRASESHETAGAVPAQEETRGDAGLNTPQSSGVSW